MLVKNHPVSVLLLEYKSIPRHPNIALPVRISYIEVVVTRFDPNVREDLDGVIVIEKDDITPFHKRDEIDTNCFSAIERLLAAARRKQPSIPIVKL